MRRVAVITGTRAEYGILRPVIARIRSSKRLELRLVVTGAHLSPRYGETVREIEREFPVAARVDMLVDRDEPAAMAESAGLGLSGMARELEGLAPDIAVVLGDRIEAFAGAAAALFCGALVAHIHGGEITRGGYDEYLRHAITKLADLHFAATPAARERIIRLGEHPGFVYHTGTPALDTLAETLALSDEELAARLGFQPPGRFALAIQHPVSTHPGTAADEIGATLSALADAGIETLMVYPNADAGGRAMREAIRRREAEGWLRGFVHFERPVYCALMRRAAFLIGNSSSGMIDAPSLGTPVINIGERQRGRERGGNVIDAPPEREAIRAAIETALDAAFIERSRRAVNPYGDGRASERIVSILESVDPAAAKNAKGLPW